MSGGTLSILGSLAQIALTAGQKRSLRSLGGLVAQVVRDETHTDEMEITEHPVEQGATITDHAYKKPAMLSLQYGWSASPSPSPGLLGLVPNLLPQKAQDIYDIYNKLLQMQAAATLLDVYTGKRAYRNMLLQSIVVDTTPTSEYTLACVFQLQELLLVSVTTTSTTNGASVGTTSDSGIVPVQQGGTFQLLPAPTFNPSHTTFLNAGPVPGTLPTP